MLLFLSYSVPIHRSSPVIDRPAQGASELNTRKAGRVVLLGTEIALPVSILFSWREFGHFTLPVGIHLVKIVRLFREDGCRQVRHHFLLSAEWRNKFDKPGNISSFPLIDAELEGTIPQPCIGLFRNPGPKGNANRMLLAMKDPELLQQEGRHDEPFQVADKELLVDGRLGQQPSHFPQDLRNRLPWRLGRARCSAGSQGGPTGRIRSWRTLLCLAVGRGACRAGLPCSGNGDAALAPKPAVCEALRRGGGTFLCLGVWLAVVSDKLEPVSVFGGRAGLRQREARAIREERRHGML